MNIERGEASVTRTQRDHFLDAIRTISTIRVVLWHSFGLPVLSYLVAAMPAMFFVFGGLLAQSASRRPISQVIFGRLRRTLLPLWFFAGTVWLYAALLHDSFTPSTLAQAALWFVPLNDPAPTSWEHGWLSSPLWFMRTLFWLLLTAPVWLRLAKRWPLLTLATGALAVFGFDGAARIEGLVPDNYPQLWWKLGDLAMYGTFAAVGAVSFDLADRIHAVRTRTWLVVSATLATAAALWLATQHVHLNVANNSHPLHMFVGAAWLSLAFAARTHIGRIADRPAVIRIINAVNRRSMTIYLWHTTVIAGTVWVVSRVDFVSGWLEPLVSLAMIIVGVAVVTVAFGWVEDLASKRPIDMRAVFGAVGRTNASHRAGFAGVSAGVAMLISVATFAPTTTQAARIPPIPSQQPPAPVFVTEDSVDQDIDDSPLTPQEAKALIEQRVRQWQEQEGARGGFVSTENLEGLTFSAASGLRREQDSAISPDDSFDMASITKFLTASIIFRLVDQGLVELDAPLPPLEAVPDFPYAEKLTPRMLLTHRSGLVNYRDTDIYKADINQVASPIDAVRASSGQPLMSEPGTTTQYSSTNFLILGFLIEQVTGQPYDDVLHQQVIEPLGMTHTRPIPSAPGEPSGATAGTLTTIGDLLGATRSILHERRYTSDTTYRTMLEIDSSSALGAGAIGFCPCIEHTDGSKEFTSFGHYGGDTVVVYVPETGVVAGLHSAENIHEERFAGVISLVNDVAAITARAVPQATVA